MTRPLWVPVNLLIGLWLLSFPSLALPLLDGQSFIYDISADGALEHGTLDAYASMYRLRVNGANYVGRVEALAADGRQANLTTFVEPASGLEIQRRIYVSKANNFARYMEILYNPTIVARTVDVEVFGNLGAGTNTTVVADQKNFLITDDVVNGVSGSMPALLHYHSQIGSTVAATHTVNGNRLSWIYPKVTVAPQARVRLIYFIAQVADVDAAKETATFIFSNPSALYEGIQAVGRNEVLNFAPAVPTPRTDFSAAPFLNVGELRTGTLSDDDPLGHGRAMTPADAYALNLAANQQVTIRLAAYFNAYLYLYENVTGTIISASNDDAGMNTTNAEMVFTAPAAGTFYIEATAHNRRERGDYTLEVIAGAANQPPRAYPFETTAETSGWIAPATVTFTDFSDDPDGQIVERCWQFGDGSPSVCSPEADNKTVTHVYEQAGHYSVGLTVRDNLNAYAYANEQVSISAIPSAVILPVSNTVTAELGAPPMVHSQTRANAFAHRYLVTVAAGQELVIDMRSEEFDSYLYLYDPYNRLLRQDDNSGGGKNARLRYTAVHSGDFLIEATSFQDSTTGNYSLTLELADKNTPIIATIEASTFLDNPLNNLFIARLPESFQATFYSWNFGDGSRTVSTDEAVVAHTFPRNGQFTVTVTAMNGNDHQANGSQTFTMNNEVQAPVARFRVSPLFGEKPLRVFFMNESASRLSGDKLNYVWQFGDGEISTDKDPAHTFTREGTYHVVLQAFSSLTQQSASFSMPVTVIDRSSANIPVTGMTRFRPQVLMAGFDPMLVDLLDTDMKIFALVRPGSAPLQTVRAIQNGTDFSVIMQHVATYANGDQRYETVYTFAKGSLPVSTFANLFGDQNGQFRVQAVDQGGQFHAFPNLEIGNNPLLDAVPVSLNIEPLQQVGVRRSQPQVLAAGFDPALVDTQNSDFTIKAVVREGLYPIHSVVLKQNQGDFSLPMRWLETLPNGDKLFAVTYTYPRDYLKKGTLGNLFGDQPTPAQFMVIVTDQAQQTHRFPEFKIGNFPQQ